LVVDDPAFAPETIRATRTSHDASPVRSTPPFSVHTRWIETEFDHPTPPSETPAADPHDPTDTGGVITTELHGRAVRVELPRSLSGLTLGGAPATSSDDPSHRSAPAPAPEQWLNSPMQGTVVTVQVADGTVVAAGETILVLEAMKMEQPITAHRAGTVRGLEAACGDSLRAGAKIAAISPPRHDAALEQWGRGIGGRARTRSLLEAGGPGLSSPLAPLSDAMSLSAFFSSRFRRSRLGKVCSTANWSLAACGLDEYM